MEKVMIYDDPNSNLVARVSFEYEGILFRDTKILSDEENNLYVEYPTRIRKKRGEIVLDEEGNTIKDIIYTPLSPNFDYFDVKVMNLYYEKTGRPKIEDIPELIPETRFSVTPVNKMGNGIIGFATILYKGMIIADVAINESPDNGSPYLIFPHFKSNPKNKMFLLYTFPFEEKVKKELYNEIIKEYDNQVLKMIE